MDRRAAAAVVALGLALWPATGPARWGGALAAVTVRGSSMHPGVVAGDLVVVADRPPYRVGDVVAHRAAPDGSLVLHRIVGVDGERFVLRGDANGFDDEIRPAAADVVGRQVLHIAGGERLVQSTARVTGPALVAVAVHRVLVVHRPPRRRRMRRS